MINVGLAFLGSNNYYADKYKVVDRSIDLLKHSFPDNISFITDANLIITKDDAADTIGFLAKKDIDILIIQTSSFCDEPVVEEFVKFNCTKLIWAPYEEVKDRDVKIHSLLSMFVAGSNMHHKFGQLAIDDWLYGEAKLFIPKLENYFSAIGALKKLSHSKIGLVGKTAYGFNNMTYGLNEAKEKYGFSTQNFDESELIQTATELSAERVDQTYKNLKLKKKNTFVDDKSIDHTIRLYIALKDLIEEHNLTSLAVSCWPTFQTEYEITPCVTLSLINDILSVPVSCEGDLMGVITMIVANELSHSTSMVFDIADILEDEEMLLLWHCGITTCSLMKTQLDDLSIINHPMINRMDKTKNKFGCSFDGLFKEQEVTALRLLNIEDKIFSVSGFVDNSYVKGFTGTRGWIKELSVQGKRKSIAEIIDSIMKNGVEHHLVVVPGNIDERLDIFSNLANLKILK